jgi:hypothetical protein
VIWSVTPGQSEEADGEQLATEGDAVEDDVANAVEDGVAVEDAVADAPEALPGGVDDDRVTSPAFGSAPSGAPSDPPVTLPPWRLPQWTQRATA